MRFTVTAPVIANPASRVVTKSAVVVHEDDSHVAATLARMSEFIRLSYKRMTTRVQRRSATDAANPGVRRRLLDATVELVGTGGPQTATSRGIASAAGENLAAITYYFGSKEELLAEAMAATARQLTSP